jgi:Pro-kumamolisin, activation domain/Putative Ig domain
VPGQIATAGAIATPNNNPHLGVVDTRSVLRGRRTAGIVLACLAAAGLAASGASARGIGTSSRGGSPRAPAVALGAPALRPSDATLIGALPRATVLHVTVTLKSRNPTALAAYAKAVAEPGSASYHQFLTVAQFAHRFGATPAAIAAVRASLRARGLRPGRPAANDLSIPVRASAGDMSTAFGTALARLRLRGGRIAIVNRSAPELPTAVAPDVQAILGLSTVAAPRPARPPTPPPTAPTGGDGTRAAAAHPTAAALRPRTSGPAPCAAATNAQQTFETGTAYRPYTVNQVADAYGFPGLYTPGDLGSGTTVAVFELEGDFPADTTAYRECFGTTGTVRSVKVDGGASAPNASDDDGYESQIDIDNLIGLAPQANVLVYQGPDTAAGSYDTDAAIITANRASVLSQSWGLCESELGGAAIAAEAALFQEATTQGMTVLAASGDVGSGDCDDNGGTGDTAPAVNDPAAQPDVTGVGGTTLSSLTGPVESAWNDTLGATGGGPSETWGAPSFQTDAATPLGVNAGSQAWLGICPAAELDGSCRLVPDVSADADPSTGYMIYYDGHWTIGDGTSSSTPLWAALVALAESSVGCDGTRLGFINPTLYGGAGAQYATDFNDVSTGGNAWISGMAAFAAQDGYDPVTGLGTPKAAADAAMLCAGPLSISAPPSLATIAGTPVTFQTSAAAAKGQPVTLSATDVPTGVTFNPATGMFSGAPDVPGQWETTVQASSSTQLQRALIPWTVTRPVITVGALATLVTALGRHVHVQARASINAPLPIAYKLNGLPKGLGISRTGLITGKPRGSGRFSVSVTASDILAAPMTSTPVIWIIKGPARLRRAEISGAARNRARLTFTVHTGYGVACVRRYTIQAPSDLTFPRRRLAHHVALRTTAAHDHRRLRFRASLHNGALRIDMRAHRSCSVQFTISGLHATLKLRREAQLHLRRATLRRVTVLAANGHGAPHRLVRYATVG